MTTKELIYSCDSKIKNIIKSESISVDTADWLIYLNEAQEFVFRENIPLNQTEYSQFDLNQRTRSNLAGLIKDKKYLPEDAKPSTGNQFLETAYIFEYPQDLKYIDVAEVTLTKDDRDFVCRVKDIEPRYYHQNRKNPYKKPYSEIAWRLDYGNSRKRYNEIIVDPIFTLKDFTLRYLTHLCKLDLDTNPKIYNLDTDIVNKAVEICLQSHQNNLYLNQLKQDN